MKQEFGGFLFRRIGPIKPERDPSGAVVEFMPQARYANVRSRSLNPYGQGPFCRFTVARGMHVPGVYVLTLAGEPVYAGKCQDLAQRFGPQGYGSIQPRNCFVGGQSTNCKVNNRILRHTIRGQLIELWFHAADDPGPVERELVSRLRPSWNAQFP